MASILLSLMLSAAAATGACDLRAPDAGAAGPGGCAQAWMDSRLRMNDLTAVGTHNSYKLAIPADELAAMVAARGEAALGVDYAHRPLAEQLDAGARQLEIDVHYDPQGGLYAKPLTALGRGAVLSPETAEALSKPGFKVIHMSDVDFRSSCTTFLACLEQVKAWSKAHPDHAPILILINAKEGSANVPGGVTPLPYDAAAFDALDAEIRSVFGDDQLITPDKVQGRRATLREAVLAGGWPTLGAARGKVFFALDEGPQKVAVYRGARRSLEGRAMFVNTDEASPAAAYLTLNDPIRQRDRIAAAVKAGFIVRTRADAETWPARRNDVTARTAALSSGAQYISTDYLWPDARFGGGYTVRLTGGEAAACNPLRSPERCSGMSIDAVAGAPARGYLTPEARPDLTKILPGPPAPGSPRSVADAGVFDGSRHLQGSPRWSLATSDVRGHMFDHFGGALGVRLTPQSAPVLNALLERAGEDRSVVSDAKRHWQSRRPYLGKDAPICEAKTDHLAGNGDYPSGHAAHGEHVAMILAELAPSRATALYERGREYADSRWICGSHSLSAAEGGLQAGAVIYAAEHLSETFRRDMDMARAEVEAALKATLP
ncbi:Ca2+-dependent phosphoinositide-specific phospholipase C [Phenylobacterium deserti]